MVDCHMGFGFYCIMGWALPAGVSASVCMHDVILHSLAKYISIRLVSIYSFHRPYRALYISFDTCSCRSAYSKQAKMVHFLFSASGNTKLLGP
jgi:hypothetical protein